MFVDAETPTGTINGTNALFTLSYAPSPAVSLLLVKNGLVQRTGTDYTLSGVAITYLPGAIPQVGDTHLAWYRTGESFGAAAPGIYRSAAVALIADRLGQRTGLEAKIITELQMAQMQLEGTEPLPWFLKQTATLTTTAAVATVALPDDFIREFEDAAQRGTLWVPNDEGTGYKAMLKDSFQHLMGQDPESGKPTHYALLGSMAYLFPTPDAAYALSLYYYANDLKLDSDIKNGWLAYAPDLLVAWAGFNIARFLRDLQAVDLFRADIAGAQARMAQRAIARAVTHTDPRLHGFEDD